jgi:SAM-dependent methyltransferase
MPTTTPASEKLPPPPVPALAPDAATPEACPGCSGRRWQTLFPANGHAIARCQQCGLVRTLGAGAGNDALYPPFDQRDTALVRAVRFAIQQLLRERAAFVRQIQPSGRLLDFGCGSGAFASLMAKGPYDVVGLEPFSLGKPLEKPRLQLLRSPLQKVRPQLGQFDVVTLWQVLEHVEDPASLLADLATHVRPDGVMIVSVPNFASWQGRLFGAEWFHLDPPRHVSHFELPSLRALLGRLGFEVFRERSFHIEYGPVGWIQSALNLILPRRNFIYEFVKDRGALAGVSRATTAANLAASVLVGTALLAPSVLVEVAASLARAGAVITVAARKKASPS